MYIPSVFFNSSGNCPLCEFSGSVLPNGVEVGKLLSGSENYIYIEVPADSAVSFSLSGGVIDAKILLIGGGGSTQFGDVGDLGGASSGDVIFQDIRITPDEYIISAGTASVNANDQAGSSIFIKKNNSSDSLYWTQYTAYGGRGPEGKDGGDNTNYIGGTCTQNGGGGGAGSAGNGLNCTGGSSTQGGNGGAATPIPSWLQGIVGETDVAGGGGGLGWSTLTQGTTPAVNSWGTGGTYLNNRSPKDGEPGRAYFLLPTSQCVTSSLSEYNFFAEGGTTDTFVSGGVQYKYHYFKTLQDTQFVVKQGITREAKVLVVGGGAGSSATIEADGTNGIFQSGGGAGAGGLRVLENITLFGVNNISVGGGGTPYLNGTGSEFVPLYIPTISYTTVGGGRGSFDSNGAFLPEAWDLASIGGSGGGGYPVPVTTGVTRNLNGASGTSGQGFAGGNGYNGNITGFLDERGGGGGGAGGPGETATNASSPSSVKFAAGGLGWEIEGFWSFLTSSVYTGDTSIAKGGYGSPGEFSDYVFPYPSPDPTSGSNNSQAWDGSGANPVVGGGGNAGIVVVVYPISGSVSGSLI